MINQRDENIQNYPLLLKDEGIQTDNSVQKEFDNMKGRNSNVTAMKSYDVNTKNHSILDIEYLIEKKKKQKILKECLLKQIKEKRSIGFTNYS